METKVCSKCKMELPATDQYFHKSKAGKYGLHSICKKCKNKYSVERVRNLDEDKKEIIRERNRANWRKNKDKYKLTIKSWREKNKEYIKKYVAEYKKIYVKKNIEKVQEQRRKYNELNKEHHKQWYEQYKNENQIKINQRKKLYYMNNKEKAHNYYLKTKDQHRLRNRKRRSLQKQTIATLTYKEWQECLKFFNYRDAYTGLDMEIPSQDHIIPVSKGGGYTKQNIVPCEPNINSSKNNSDMETWFRKQPYFNEERLQKIYQWMGVKNNVQQLKII